MKAHALHTLGLGAVILALGAAAPAAAQWGEQPVPAELMEPTGIELELPFPYGIEVEVSQAHGTFSHVERDHWGWDFRAPEGAPVVAAHDGVVRLARGDSTQGGCFREAGPWANYVILSHESGYETQYLHFSKVFVRPGQRVKAGEAIGAVGSTGFSCGSHLHFQLQKSGSHWANQSVPATFRVHGDPKAKTVVVSQTRCPRTDQLQAQR